MDHFYLFIKNLKLLKLHFSFAFIILTSVARIFFKNSCFEFHRRKKVIHVWDDMKVSKWLQNFRFGVNCLFKKLLMTLQCRDLISKISLMLITGWTGGKKHKNIIYVLNFCQHTIYLKHLTLDFSVVVIHTEETLNNI